jgi:hypothetical protein
VPGSNLSWETAYTETLVVVSFSRHLPWQKLELRDEDFHVFPNSPIILPFDAYTVMAPLSTSTNGVNAELRVPASISPRERAASTHQVKPWGEGGSRANMDVVQPDRCLMVFRKNILPSGSEQKILETLKMDVTRCRIFNPRHEDNTFLRNGGEHSSDYSRLSIIRGNGGENWRG